MSAMLKRRRESSFVSEAMSLVRCGLFSDPGDHFMVGLLSGVSQGAAAAAAALNDRIEERNKNPDAETEARAAMSERERELHDKITAMEARERERERDAETRLISLQEREQSQIRELEYARATAEENAREESEEARKGALKLAGRTCDKLQSMIMEVAAIEEVTTALGVSMAEFEKFCEETEIDWKGLLSMRRTQRRKNLGLSS